MNQNKYAIFDIDNCIADDGWRIKYIDMSKTGHARYELYHELSIKDEVSKNWLGLEFYDFTPVFITSRPEKFRRITEQWFLNKDVFSRSNHSHGLLFMRLNTDTRSSVDVKRDLLKTFMTKNNVTKENILYALDDREDVVRMYNVEFGLSSKKVCAHELDYPSELQSTPSEPKQYTSISELPGVTVPQILRAAAVTFEERGKQYDDLYKTFGNVMLSLFPCGLTLKTSEDFARFTTFNLMMVKAARYSHNLPRGGHQDSAHDAIVYAAILEQLTLKKKD